MSLLVVGSVAFDALETPHRQGGTNAGRRGELFRAGGQLFHTRARGGHRRR
jgi:hypothetical protein